MKAPAIRTTLVYGVLLPIALTLFMLAGSARAAPKKAKPPITLAAQQALWAGDFAEVEKQNTYFKQPGRFDPDGESQLRQFRDGLDKVFENAVPNAEPYLKEVDILTLQWATENPKSAIAHILHAKALVQHGWSYRGNGYAKEVPPEAWNDFRAYLRRAAEYINLHADVALTDSSAHIVLLQIGRGLDFGDEQMAAIAHAGLMRNPDDTDLYSSMMSSLLPKWGGNAKALDSYINYAVEQTRAKHGSGMYARLYSSAAKNQYEHALFEDSHADWDKMKQSYEDILARYPNSAVQRNRYAYMACLAKDKPTLLRLLGELGTKTETAEWGENGERSLESCRRWATAL